MVHSDFQTLAILPAMRQNRRIMARPQQSLEKRIQKIKQQLVELGDLRPGALSQQYNVCGKPRCQCKATPPLRHGPYYQISFTRQGKSTTQFVRKPDVEDVQQQLANYRQLRTLVEEWIGLSAELSALRLRQRHQESQKSAKKRPKSQISKQKAVGSRDL